MKRVFIGILFYVFSTSVEGIDDLSRYFDNSIEVGCYNAQNCTFSICPKGCTSCQEI